jgi:hypothetical protein
MNAPLGSAVVSAVAVGVNVVNEYVNFATRKTYLSGDDAVSDGDAFCSISPTD